MRRLIDIYQQHRLDLNPHYQRNAIWTTSAQKQLIETVQHGYPIPNFFVRTRPEQKFEMVDGQQRGRTLMGFWKGDIADNQRLRLTDAIKGDARFQSALESFLNYALTVCILDQGLTDTEVESFYVLVNSSGMRLNRPELRKAAYYDTRFLRLATEIASHSLFENLEIFTDKSVDRMNDIDFVSELLVLLKYGFTDKKETVDSTYESDITEQEFGTLQSKALEVLRRINTLHEAVAIGDTRFRQKGDFYTLFGFIAPRLDKPDEFFQHCYQTIIRLSPHIRPSQEECDPLMNYALNCVTQSNSKRARENRDQFFSDLFLNLSNAPNQSQEAIRQYLRLDAGCYVSRWRSLLFPLESLTE